MKNTRRSVRHGFAVVEVLAAVGVIAVLLSLVLVAVRGSRKAARIATAQERLRQVATGLELYFTKHQSYPPAGSNLSEVLAPYVGHPSVFTNPLRDEDTPGDDISRLYEPKTVAEVDAPGNYITCFPSDGTHGEIVVLSTGPLVNSKRNPGYGVESSDPSELIASLARKHTDVSDQSPDTGDLPSQGEDDDDSASEETTEPEEETGPDPRPDDYTEESPAGVITPKDCYVVTFEVCSDALTWGPGGPTVPITVTAIVSETGTHGAEPGYDDDGMDDDELDGGRKSVALFGEQAICGETTQLVLRSGEPYTLEFTAIYGGWSACYTSDGDVDHVLTLRNGDLPPEFDPEGGQITVRERLRSRIHARTGGVRVGDNQVLYLVELGSQSRASKQFDFQDLIVLATFNEAPNPTECDAPVEETDEGFEISEGGEVVTRTCSDVQITCIGSQFGYADGTLVPVRARARLGTQAWRQLWAGAAVRGGETHGEASMPAGTTVALEGEIAGEYERWLYGQYGYPLSYRSDARSDQVLVFRRGDAPPDFAPGFACQASVGDLVAPYIDPQTGVVTVAQNEAIYLWDFNPVWTGQGIDYQDLIILATAEAAAYECEGEAEDTPEEPEPEVTPAPVLAFTPDAITTADTSFTLRLANTAAEEKDVAEDVAIVAEVLEGEAHVSKVVLGCARVLGDIAAGTTHSIEAAVKTNRSWATAYEQNIRVRFRVTEETNAPETTVGTGIVVTVAGPPRPAPVLTILPGTVRTRNKSQQFEFRNTAGAGHDAADTRFAVAVLSGAKYLESVQYNGDIGVVGGLASRYRTVKAIVKQNKWGEAPRGTEIRLLLTLTHEGNNTNENVGKTATLVIYR